MKITASLALLLGIAFAPATASAQLASAADGPIVYGHHHLYVTDIDAHKKFWIDTLGGKPVAVRPDIVAFPNVYVFLRQQAPTGGSKGSTVNHLGFQVPDVRAMVERVRAAGFRIVTKEETTNPEKDGVAFTAVEDTSIAFVMGPDDVKVELFENRSAKEPIALHHVHFFVADPVTTRDWYVKTFGAKPRKRGNFDSADLPGVNLTFSPSPTPVVGTKGRAIDHIGFEVRGIEGFVKQIESAGIVPDRAVMPVAALGLKITFVTDPWGTYIELTDGLVNIK